MEKISKYFLIFIFLITIFSCRIFQKKVDNKQISQQNSDKEKFQILFCQANEYLLFNNKEKATESLNSAISVNPQSAVSFYLLSEIKNSQKSTEEAALYAQKAVELQPLNYWYRKNYADILETLKRFLEAEEVYKYLITNKSENRQTYQNLVKLAEIQNNNSNQIYYLNILLEKYDFNEDDALKLYSLYMKNNESTKSENILNKLIENYSDNLEYKELKVEFYIISHQYEKAKKLNDELLVKYPDNGKVHLSEASFCKLTNNKSEFYKQIKFVFLSDDVDLETKIRIIVSDPGTDFSDEQTEELINVLLENYGDSKIVFILYSDFLQKNEDYDEAVKNLQIAFQLDNSDYNLLNKLLQLEFDVNDDSDLYDDSKNALDLFPTQPLIYFYNGIAAFRLKNYEETLKILNKGNSLIIDDTDLQAQFLFYSAQSKFYLENYTESDLDFEKLLNLQPDNPSASEAYAYSLAVRNINRQKAKILVEKALRYNNESSVANFTEAILKFNENQIDEALKYIDKAYNSDPENYEISELYGNILEKKGEIEKAKQKWMQSVKSGNPKKELGIRN